MKHTIYSLKIEQTVNYVDIKILYKIILLIKHSAFDTLSAAKRDPGFIILSFWAYGKLFFIIKKYFYHKNIIVEISSFLFYSFLFILVDKIFYYF